jgi:hypothetical protein
VLRRIREKFGLSDMMFSTYSRKAPSGLEPLG